MTEPSSPRARIRSGATLLDVAHAAGVSVMTVSRVVNDNSNVAEHTRLKVLAAIDALKYRVNLAARAARVGTFRVGLLYSNPSPAFMSAFLVGALERCGQRGAQLILEHCKDLRGQRQAIGRMLGQSVDGMLIPPPLCDSKITLQQLDEMGMPAVAVATGLPSPLASAVRIDDYQGALTMTRYLISIGHRDIAFVMGDPKHTPAQLRYAAFVDAMKEANLPIASERVAHGLFTYRSGLEAARQLLGQTTRPTAIFASNDDMAAGVIAVAHGMRLHVPEDLAVCGFDDTPVATTVWPEVTTIHQPIADMARSAVDLVIDQIRRRRAGEPKRVQHQVLPFSLIRRESSGREPPGA